MATKNKVGAPVLPADADPTDPNDRRYRRKSHIPANAQGVAYPERIAYLRETFPRMAWVEAYDTQGRPDRYGEITLREIAELKAQGSLFEYEAFLLELKREYCLVRWRVWFDAKNGNRKERAVLSPGATRRRAAKAEARRAEYDAKAGEREAKRVARVARGLEALKARKKEDPSYGIPTKSKPGRVRGKWRGPEEGRHKTGRPKAEFRNPAFDGLCDREEQSDGQGDASGVVDE